MVQPSDLARLMRLGALCDARHHLAIQDETQAAEQARAATRQRMGCEAGVSEAEQDWQRALASELGPDLASAAGAALITQAATLTSAIDRELRSGYALTLCKEARREARGRMRQVEEVIALCRRTTRRRRDERLLCAIEDRTANRWRQA